MKALPLWQPWATLVAVGAKRVETRSYPPGRLGLRLGQRIAIHATKTGPSLEQLLEADAVYMNALRGAYGPTPRAAARALPRGAIVATARIGPASPSARLLERLDDLELMLGDYSADRYGWPLEDVQPLADPLPWLGSQGTFDVPDDLLGLAPSPVQLELGAAAAE